VFFVISGFLMTGIIFRGLENNNFNLFNFYVARANRIIPALAVLCLGLLVFGWFFVEPINYRALGKHIASSVGFISNVIYWSESGYFDGSSHEKWLLHTWSLSVEWQFYIIYPIVLVALKRFLSLDNVKRLIIIGTVLAFSLSVIVTMKWANLAYYLLPTRAWEMMMGGLAFLYPWVLSESKKKVVEFIGLALILGSYAFITSDTPWPGYFALAPVMGSYFMIVSNRQSSVITNNRIFQYLGKWSYSIYLWHWPIVTYLYMAKIREQWLIGILLSLVLGFISFKYIESFKFKRLNHFKYIYMCKPFYMALIVFFLGSCVFFFNGFSERTNLYGGEKSPKRSCSVRSYENPENSCSYFYDDVEWAIIGDSHSIELGYAMAEKLKYKNIGLKQFSYSSCNFYSSESSDCKRWYKEAIDYIYENKNIKNVIVNQRWTKGVRGEGDLTTIDSLLLKLSESKDRVYVVLPFPYLDDTVSRAISEHMLVGNNVSNIKSRTRNEYLKNNELVINHFKGANYPNNVHIINPIDVFCDIDDCYSVKDNLILYFDDNHPSVSASRLIVDHIHLP
jgi:peptidoglycan/LPS O-acetylase OafA/YrhL